MSVPQDKATVIDLRNKPSKWLRPHTQQAFCFRMKHVKELGKILLIIFALYAPVKVENMILGGGIIRSGGNTKIIMVIDIVGTWCIGIPLCLLAAYVFRWGIVGVYALLTTEEIFRLAVALVIFRKRKWMISLS